MVPCGAADPDLEAEAEAEAEAGATPDALDVATGLATFGGAAAVPPVATGDDAPGPAAGDAATGDVAAVDVAGIVRASAPAMAPTPTTSAASDQLDHRRTCRNPRALDVTGSVSRSSVGGSRRRTARSEP